MHDGVESFMWPNIRAVGRFPFSYIRLEQLGVNLNGSQSEIRRKLTKKTNLTGKDLAWAAWTPGELVERIEFGNTVINYSVSDQHFEYWTLSYEYFSPFWKLTVPPTSNGSDTLKIQTRKHVVFPQCQGREENKSLCDELNDSKLFRSKMAIYSNCDCNYDSYTFKCNFHLIDLFCGQRTILSMEKIYSEYSRSRSFRKTSIAKSEYHVEYYTKDTRLDGKVNLEDCVLHCHMEVGNSYHCVWFNKLTLKESLASYCFNHDSREDIYRKVHSLCPEKCSKSKQNTYWKLMEDCGKVFTDNVTITLNNTGIKILYPVESYSFIKFLADVGGTASFFLELAIMPTIVAVTSYCSHFLFHLGQRNLLKNMRSIGKILLAISISSLFFHDLYQSIDSSEISYIGYSSRMCYKDLDCSNSAAAREWIASIFAQVSLGCTPNRTSIRDECFYYCAFGNLRNQSADSNKWMLSSMPPCSSEVTANILQQKIILDEDAFGFIDSGDIVSVCNSECYDKANISLVTGDSFYPVIEQRRQTTYLDALCLIFGLLGLYFGFSMLHLNRAIAYFFRRNSTRSFRLIKTSVTMLTVYLGVLIILQRVFIFNTKKFIIRAPIIENDLSGHQIVMTICPVVDPYYQYASYDKYSHAGIATVFDDILCYGILVKAYNKFSECFSCRLNATFQNPLFIMKVSNNISNGNIALVFNHFASEEVFWDGKIDQIVQAKATPIVVERINIFRPANSNSKPYRSVCYTRCINESINSLNSSKIAGENPYSYVQDPSFLADRVECQRKCSAHPFRFVTGRSKRERTMIHYKDFMVLKFELQPGEIIFFHLILRHDSINIFEDVYCNNFCTVDQ